METSPGWATTDARGRFERRIQGNAGPRSPTMSCIPDAWTAVPRRKGRVNEVLLRSERNEGQRRRRTKEAPDNSGPRLASASGLAY
jgi:hypothetical protein